MIKLGITGGIGSGKSVVSQILNLYGIPVYIADLESKRLTDSSAEIREKLTDIFGYEIYTGGKLNKTLLASRIFNDKVMLDKVNSVIHPVVKSDLSDWIESNSDKKAVACESAILFESGFNAMFDSVIMVLTPLDIRLQRILERDNTSYAKAEERIGSQMPDDAKAGLSDFVIDNSGDYSLLVQVEAILGTLNYL